MYTGIMTSTCLPFTGKCRYFENLNSRCFDLFFRCLICRYFDHPCWEDVEEIILRWINILHLFSRRYSVKIAVCQLLFRERTRHIGPILYNNFVLKTNRLLKAELAKLDNITYWNLKGLKDNHQGICWDDVHLNWRSGYPKYYKNIRGAILNINRL